MGKPSQLDQFNAFWSGIVDDVRAGEGAKASEGRAHPVVFGKWEVWFAGDDETLHYRGVDEALENEHEVSKEEFLVQYLTELQRNDDRNQWMGLYRQFKEQLG
ncbi:MAG: hypothetical protein LKJ05_04825 [Bifidobacteriaceae bacterium]|jgi:hypothetical protein|nr:hypothetical protein [Bifidobacteriaceae bacterium]